MKTIDIKNLLSEGKINIIDIRDNDRYMEGHIDGAINIEMSRLMRNPSMYLNTNDTYYIYCEFGYKSRKVCSVLEKLGYNVIDIKDGYYSYQEFIE